MAITMMIVTVMRKDLVRQSSSSKKMNILENMLSVEALIEPAQTIGGVVPWGQDRLLFFLAIQSDDSVWTGLPHWWRLVIWQSFFLSGVCFTSIDCEEVLSSVIDLASCWERNAKQFTICFPFCVCLATDHMQYVSSLLGWQQTSTPCLLMSFFSIATETRRN